MILHLVLYQPKASSTAAERAGLTSALQAASRNIPTIRQVRVGRTVDLKMGYEHRSSGQQFDYCAVFEFIDDNGLKAYLGHAEHLSLAQHFWNVCERTMILDVSAVDPLHEDIIGQVG